jgi:hypothetical protein
VASVFLAVAGAGWLVMLVVFRLKAWRDRHESHVQQRISPLLAGEDERLLTPEAQQRHLDELRAEAEWAAAGWRPRRRR